MRAAVTMIQCGVKSHMAANIDVITKTHKVKESGIPLDTAWVKFHQDDDTDSAELDLPAQLNSDANAAAGAFLSNPPATLHPTSSPIVLPSTIVTLEVNGITAMSKWDILLRTCFTPTDLRSYITTKTGYTSE
eukprot:1345210-Ditylum_brightwellii.AAC.1